MPMKKIPSLFKRDYEGTRLVYDEIVPGTEWVLAGEGVATRKIDGTSCLMRGVALYKRYDARAGKGPPAGFEPAQEARHHCLSCFCEVQHPRKGAGDAAQNAGSAQGISQRVSPQEDRDRPITPSSRERLAGQAPSHVPAVPSGLHGAQGEAFLLPELRLEMEWAHGTKPGNKKGSTRQPGKVPEPEKRKKLTNHSGYILVYKPGYPGTEKTKGYILEHRWVMEQYLGRRLDSWEHLHHKNGVKTDNRLENLEVVTNATHRGLIICPHCQQEFQLH